MPSTALDYITIRGFKSIASIEKLELKPINVVIGPNGSGKSNFIGVFAFLHAIREGRLRNYVTEAGGAERILHFGSKTTPEVYFFLSFRDEVDQYKLELSPTSDDGLFPSSETVYFWKKGQYAKPHSTAVAPRMEGREAGISAPELTGTRDWVKHRLGSWRLYHLRDTSTSSPMRKTAKVNDNEFLRSDGSNLAAFLYYLRVKHSASYSLIQRTVQRVALFFDDFRLKPLSLEPNDVKLEWRHCDYDGRLLRSSSQRGRGVAGARRRIRSKNDREGRTRSKSSLE